MRRLSLLVMLVLVAMLVAAPSVGAAPKSPFVGAWTGNDPAPPAGDGSKLLLNISSGKTVQISFVDKYGSVCVHEGAPTVEFNSKLRGTISGDTLDATFTSARCGPVLLDFLVGVGVTYTYDGANDTIDDGSVIYHRH